jgi:hypothetical protein
MSTDPMSVALRVLTAVHIHEQPNEPDLILLRSFCPDHRDKEPEEMACAVIQQILRRGMEARKERRLSQTA